MKIFIPRYVEVSFSQMFVILCGCGPAFSSKWYDEIKNMDPTSLGTIQLAIQLL